MTDDVANEETAIEVVKAYADRECVGEFGEVVETEEHDAEWTVEFRTHTFSNAYVHRIRVTKPVGNVVAHDRSSHA